MITAASPSRTCLVASDVRIRRASTPAVPSTGRPALLATALLAFFGINDQPSHAATPGGVTVADAWLRVLTPTTPAGGYFELRNDGATTVELVGASSPACETLMLHESVERGGMSSMRDVGPLAIPAGGTLRFAPGSYHLMCTQPPLGLKPGGSVPVTFRFGDGSSLETRFAVRGLRGP